MPISPAGCVAGGGALRADGRCGRHRQVLAAAAARLGIQADLRHSQGGSAVYITGGGALRGKGRCRGHRQGATAGDGRAALGQGAAARPPPRHPARARHALQVCWMGFLSLYLRLCCRHVLTIFTHDSAGALVLAAACRSLKQSCLMHHWLPSL